MALISYQTLRGGRVYDIDLRAPPAERWQAIGRELGDELQDLLANVVDLCEENLSGVPNLLRPLAKAALHGASRLGGSVIGTIAGWYGGEYVAEISGLAKAAEVPFSQVLLSNLMYDFSQAGERWGGASACSSFSCNVRGKPVLARNMDWCWPESIGRHTILVRYHRSRANYLSIGLVGMVGALSAVYEGRWACVLNQAPAGKLPVNYLQLPTLQHLRAACDGFGTFRGLIRRLREYRTMSPFFTHVVGVEPDEHAVVSGMGTEFSVRKKGDAAVMIQTNHYLDHEHLNPDEDEFEDDDGTRWYWDTFPRYRALEQRLKRLPRSLDAAIGKLARSPVTHDGTQQQMVLCPATGAYRLRVRSES